MRLVAVSVVKNEADIIEAFVRHTRAWADHHLIFDHDSTDGTREILQALQAEGLPLTLYADGRLANLQQARSNHLVRLAIQNHEADWILPLDADEFITGHDRAELENVLQQAGHSRAVSLPLHDYCATREDDSAESNPALRLRYSRPSPSVTRKIFVPRALALDPALSVGKGSHALYHGNEALPDSPLPPGWVLSHLALRSPQHQVLRVVLAELQKLSRGQAAAGLDVHYRFGYQLLADDPELFFATLTPPASSLRLQPIRYDGGALQYTPRQEWARVARALLPYLEQLAGSHGRLVDAASVTFPPPPADHPIKEISAVAPSGASGRQRGDNFAGFTAVSGWGALEGPVPEAFLPPFHWGYAPATVLTFDAPDGGAARLDADLLTYCENQTVTFELNATRLHRLDFSRTNQRERVSLPLTLHPGRNLLSLHYSQSLVTARDPRALAAIFLRLRITAPDRP